MASPLPGGHFEVECSDLSIKVGFHPRGSIDSPRPSCGSPPDAKRQDRDPSDPRSTSVVSDVYPLQTRMRHLFSAFTEMGYLIKRIHAVPDFVCDGALGTLAVEAMTVNPTQGRTGAGVPPPPLGTAEEQRAFVSEYMPIKFGSTLTSKLAKKYWE